MKNKLTPLTALTAVLLLSAQLLSACSPVTPAATMQPGEAVPAALASAAAAPVVPDAGAQLDPLEFERAMRKLWEDHIILTRTYLIAAAADLPESGAAAARLLQNQTDIGDAITPFYGEEAGDELASLLTEHINIAVELIAAAKAGDTAAAGDAQTRWEANGTEMRLS